MALHRHTALSPLTIAVAAAGVFAQQNAPVGYDDTPKQPNNNWHIHDPIARNRAWWFQGPLQPLLSHRRTTQLSSSARESI